MSPDKGESVGGGNGNNYLPPRQKMLSLKNLKIHNANFFDTVNRYLRK